MKSIKSLFKNEAARKIVLFFNENPNCIDTAKGISLWIGWDISIIQKALDQLVKEGINLINKPKTIAKRKLAPTPAKLTSIIPLR